MRPTREITANEENFRIEPRATVGGAQIQTIRRDPIEREPVGTIVLQAFRITGYDRDCDGSLMARLDNIDKDGVETGWSPTHLGIDPSSTLVVTSDELAAMFKK